MSLQLYNSLTRKLEEFKPINEGRVGIYVCGPTVYGHAHLGHAKSYVSFDILVRYMRYLGYNVTYVQNITDVGHLTDDADQGEDKIAKAAAKVAAMATAFVAGMPERCGTGRRLGGVCARRSRLVKNAIRMSAVVFTIILILRLRSLNDWSSPFFDSSFQARVVFRIVFQGYSNCHRLNCLPHRPCTRLDAPGM